MMKIIITGAGTGFGKFYSLELAKRGHQVYSAVELPSQISLCVQKRTVSVWIST